MAPCKRQLKATRHLICGSCSNCVDFVKSGCEKSWAEVQADSFSFECRGCTKMKELEVELEELRLLVVAMVGREQGGCASSSGGGTVDDKVGKDTRDARESSPQPGRKLRGGKVTGRRETGRKETGRKGTGGKTTGAKERGVGETGGKEKGVGETGGKEKGVGETGGKTTGVKEREVGETRAKEWEVGETGAKETGGKGSGQNVMEGIERKSYSAAVIEGVRKRARVFVGDSIVRKTDRVLNKGDDVVVCLPGAKIEAITERVKPMSNHPKNISEKRYRCVCLNARSIVNKKNELNIMVEDIDPHIIGITESWANIDITDAELGLTGYVMFRKDRIGRRGGGVILYVKESIQAYEIKLEREADCDEAVWCKIVSGNSKLTIGLAYRSPNINEEDNTKIKNAIKEVSKGECIIMGDFNHGHIQWNSLESTGIEDQQFLFLIQDSFLTQHVLEPTRGENVLDIVLSSQKELVDNVKIFEPLGNSDHNQIHFDINVKSESKNKKTYKRNFHKGNYKDMRKYLAKLDWNNMLMNKTAIECWNILKYEIESIIDKFVPFQKQGKRCRKKHLSKEAIRKIMLKQTMWRVYRRTRKDEDYAKYKEALNAATTEIRQSKRSYEQKLACNIKK